MATDAERIITMTINYEMKKIAAPSDVNACKEMAQYILTLLKGSTAPKTINGTTYISERLRQFWTWGAKSFMLIGSTDGCYGLQFAVSGLKQSMKRASITAASDSNSAYSSGVYQ